jgi:hypothetical protein
MHSFSNSYAITNIDSLNIGNTTDEVLRVYIDYAKSDNTERFIRSEIPFVSYVRDPHLAQLHILITDQSTGSRGRRFTLAFIGRENFMGQDQTLYYVSPQSDTDAMLREGLTHIIKMGMMPYISQTVQADRIEIRSKEDHPLPARKTMDDPWDYWIFYIDVGGGLDSEESRDAFNITSAIRADRVTDFWKINNRFNFEYEREKFSDDNTSYTSTFREWEVESSVVKSLTNKWSAGFFAEIFSTTFRNIQFRWSLAPALEYNFFPWPESERRKFILAYRVGFRSLKYIEETLFDKTTDHLWYHSLAVELDMTQPWGNVDIEIEALHYPELYKKYSLNLDIEFALRISSGWEFVLAGQIESIHDQIYLPKGDATIEEILLKRRQLATTYALGFNLGFRYTFGSIYNNIINERL